MVEEAVEVADVYALAKVAYGLFFVPYPVLSFPDDDIYKSFLITLNVLVTVFVPSVTLATTFPSVPN